MPYRKQPLDNFNTFVILLVLDAGGPTLFVFILMNQQNMNRARLYRMRSRHLQIQNSQRKMKQAGHETACFFAARSAAPDRENYYTPPAALLSIGKFNKKIHYLIPKFVLDGQ